MVEESGRGLLGLHKHQNVKRLRPQTQQSEVMALVGCFWRCLRDNICLLSPDTIERLNHLIVSEGHRLAPEAAETVRGDSFVVKTDVHYPTDSSLIGDGLRTIIATARRLAGLLGQSGWRQYKHLLRSLKQQLRTINRTAASKGRDYRKRLRDAYRAVLETADRILRGRRSCSTRRACRSARARRPGRSSGSGRSCSTS